MSKEKKKPDANSHERQFMYNSAYTQSDQIKSDKVSSGQAKAAIEARNQPHNAKKEALGRNTRQG